MSKRTTIAYASSLLADDLIAFKHAVSLASYSDSHLYTIHAEHESASHVEDMPEAQALLQQWGGGSLDHTHLRHKTETDTVETLLEAIEQVQPDMLVLGKHLDTSITAILHQSISAPVLRNIQNPALVIPLEGKGFLHPVTGQPQVKNVLIPVEDEEIVLLAFHHLHLWIEMLGLPPVNVTLVHAGKTPSDDLVWPEDSEHQAIDSVELITHDGTVEEAVKALTQDKQADLVLMLTRGQNSILDVLRGTHTGRILNTILTPTLVMNI